LTNQPLRDDLKRLMELVITRHVWGRDLTAEQMQEKLASALDDGRRHPVAVVEEKADGSTLSSAPNWVTWSARSPKQQRLRPTIGLAEPNERVPRDARKRERFLMR
jgi:hypothetical protein